jgi:hypothetical protein
MIKAPATRRSALIPALSTDSKAFAPRSRELLAKVVGFW